MPDVPAIRKIDSISDVPYRIGYSFRNPVMVKPLTMTRERPYFGMDWAVKGPTQVKEELYNKGTLQRYPTVWRRAAKAIPVRSLGVVGNRTELPSFQELGEAPGPTDAVTTTSAVDRSPWGFLDNMIKTAGGLISQAQQVEIQKAQAQQYPYGMPQFFTPGGGGLGTLGWMAVLGAAGVGVFMFMRNR
jgi:hypothetical protein